MSASLKKYGLFAIIALLAFAAYSWMQQQNSGYGDAFVSGNGRLEATEVDIATKLAGRVDSILVKEGEMVKTGQVLAPGQNQEGCRSLRQWGSEIVTRGLRGQTARPMR